MSVAGDFGKLLLPRTPDVAGTAALWSDTLSNRIALAVTVIAAIFMMKDILRLLPHIGNCLVLRRGHLHLEHNRTLARIRNHVAWLFSLPFAILCNRYGVFRPEFFDAIPAVWSLPATFGMLAAYSLLRTTAYRFAPSRLHGEDRIAVIHVPFVYLILLVLVMCAGCLVLSLSGAPDDTIRTVLTAGTAAAFLVCLAKEGQIFASCCGLFSTILYLCALEIFPAGVLVACTALF